MQWIYSSHIFFIGIILLQKLFPEPEIREVTIILTSISGILLSLAYYFIILNHKNFSIIHSSDVKHDKTNNKYQIFHTGFVSFLFIIYILFFSSSLFSSILKNRELVNYKPNHPEFSFGEKISMPEYREPEIMHELPANLK